MLWRSFDFFTLRHSDLNTTLTYFLMDNFCPCLLRSNGNSSAGVDMETLVNSDFELYANKLIYR